MPYIYDQVNLHRTLFPASPPPALSTGIFIPSLTPLSIAQEKISHQTPTSSPGPQKYTSSPLQLERYLHRMVFVVASVLCPLGGVLILSHGIDMLWSPISQSLVHGPVASASQGLVRMQKQQAPLQTYKIRVGIWTRSPGDPYTH